MSWCLQKQDIVTTLTCEAEYIAACNAAKEAVWLRQLMREIRQSQDKSTLILADNQGAIVLTKDQSNHARSKHIDVQYHYVQERTLAGNIYFRYV